MDHIESLIDFMLSVPKVCIRPAGIVCLQVSLSISVVGTASGEFLFGILAPRNNSVGALELHTNSCLLFSHGTATAESAAEPARYTVLHGPVEDGIAL